MNIPKKVNIGYKDYTVNKVNDYVVEDNKVCYGNIEFDEGQINISTLYTEEQQKCTFIHECLHGIDDIVEANLTEDQVRLMSKGLYDFIKSNSNIFIEKDIKTSILLDNIEINKVKNMYSNKLGIVKNELGESLILNGENIPGVTKYSISKKEKEPSVVTITLECPNINISNTKEY